MLIHKVGDWCTTLNVFRYAFTFPVVDIFCDYLLTFADIEYGRNGGHHPARRDEPFQKSGLH